MLLKQLEIALLSLTKDVVDKFSIAIHTDEGTISINSATPRKAASLAKLFIMAEAYQQVEKGSLSLEKLVYINSDKMVEGSGVIKYLTNSHVYSYQNLLELMIIVSDNTASNILLDAVGIDRTNRFAKRIGCNHTFIKRKFMDDQAQLEGNENATTAGDIVSLLKLFSRENDYFSMDSRGEILEIFSNQQFNSKLSAFQQTSSRIKIYHKTGELHGVEHDAAIMIADGKIVEAAILTEGWDNNGDAQNYITAIGKLLMAYLVD
ncbi:serine hydrolase [Oceanobacillus longus]|uniref:Serine hydrolase n=1 Tax=Oceanobacillus longus TaxID=930120 RepID=A0ABV8GX58_9BACI